MLVFIEQRHIDAARGWKSDPTHCPIARAMNEQLGFNGIETSSTPAHVMVSSGHTHIVYTPKTSALNFMSKFDNGDTVWPCVVEVTQKPMHVPLLDWIDMTDPR